jgi:hypothetical protein
MNSGTEIIKKKNRRAPDFYRMRSTFMRQDVY